MKIKQIAIATAMMAAWALTACNTDDGMAEVDLGTTTWHDGFLWTDADTTWQEKTMDLKFNDDAIEKGKGVRLAVTNSNGDPVSTRKLQVEMDGKIAANNIIEVMPDGRNNERAVKLRFRFLPEAETGRHQLHLKVLDGSVDRINHAEVNDGDQLKVRLPIKFNKEMNPLKRGLLITLGVICILIVVARLILHRKTFGKTARKSVCVSDPNRQILFGPRTVKFGGCSEVVFTNKQEKQGFINRFFFGKTDYQVNAIFKTPIHLKPGHGKREINITGRGYTFSATKMKYSDVPVSATDFTTQNTIEFS